MPRPIWDDLPDREVKPRDIASNPRCPDCKSPDPRGMPPMFHPAHPWGPCIVPLTGTGKTCPCATRRQEPAGNLN